MRRGVTAVPGALPWLAWLEDDGQEIVASSYHRTRGAAEAAARGLRRPAGSKSGSRPAQPAPATERSNASLTPTSPTRPEIILLDLNYTLIGDQQVSRYIRPIEKRVELEQYRMDLVEALAGGTYRVLMLTARPERQKAATLAAISRRIPQLRLEAAYFNTHDEQPPDAKRRMLKFVLAAGILPSSCFAVESNPKTRAMYAVNGIKAAPYSARLVARLEAVKSEMLPLL